METYGLEQYGITVFPLGIVKAGKLYHDGVDIRTADIASHVDAGGEITTTNAVNVSDYEDAFRALMEKYKPRFFLHGHIHQSYGKEYKRYDKYQDTHIINAYERCVFDFEDENLKEHLR